MYFEGPDTRPPIVAGGRVGPKENDGAGSPAPSDTPRRWSGSAPRDFVDAALVVVAGVASVIPVAAIVAIAPAPGRVVRCEAVTITLLERPAIRAHVLVPGAIG